MFRCKECGSEYEVKPEYCDCGNDTFDEVIVQKPVSQAAPNVTVQKSEASVRPNVYQNNTRTPEPKRHKSFSEQYPEFERMKQKFDPIATIVFLFCVILSVIVLFFVGNPEEKTENTTNKPQPAEVQKINIPQIDTFWNNSTAGIINNEKSKQKYAAQASSQPQPVVNPIPVQPQPATTQPVPQPQQTQQNQSLISKVFGGNNNQSAQKSVQKQAQSTVSKQQPQKTQPVQSQRPQTQQKTQQQKVQTQQTQTQKPQTVQQPPRIPKTTQSIATQPKTNNTTSHTTTKTNTTSTMSQTKTTTAQQTTKPAQTQKPKTKTTTANIPTASTMRPKATIDTQALKKELDNYKIGLRNTIGRKVDFTRVVGDGECVISFKIASSGKLTNRSFAKQSSNITLNDAVYSAIMSTPSYNPPPSGYNNETLSLKIRFYNGNYDVSLY